jgi:hypothetical protein
MRPLGTPTQLIGHAIDPPVICLGERVLIVYAIIERGDNGVVNGSFVALDRNCADWNRASLFRYGCSLRFEGLRHCSEAVIVWRRGQALDQVLRDRVLAHPDATLAVVAERFGVSKSYLSKTPARLRNLGQSIPGPQHNHVPLRLEPFRDALKVRVTPVPDAKLRDLRDWLQTTHTCASATL